MKDYFMLQDRGSNMKTEILAGITTFLSMSYILIVNPSILSYGFTEPIIANGVFFATCIGAAVGTLLMGLWARLPFAQAPGMGMNAFFAFTVMTTLGAMTGVQDIVKQYQMALALVFIAGILMIIITFAGIREKIIEAIPQNIKAALGCGIGIFIAFLGLQNAGIVVNHDATLVAMVDFSDIKACGAAFAAVAGLIIIVVLTTLKIRGAILISIVASTGMAYLLGAANYTGLHFGIGQQFSDWLNFSLFHMDFSSLFSGGDIIARLISIILLVLSLSLVDLFDSLGYFLGTASRTGLLDDNRNKKNLKNALCCDSIATAAGALAGTSTVTTFAESQTGIEYGGRTGITSVVTGICFLGAIFLAPLVYLIPSCATAPALIYVGYLMASGIKDMDFSNLTEAFSGFLTLAIIPLTCSVTNGIAFGLISYTAIKLFSGKGRELKSATIILSLLFVINFVL